MSKTKLDLQKPIVKAWMYTFTWADSGYHPSSLVYADTAGKAKRQAYIKNECDDHKELLAIHLIKESVNVADRLQMYTTMKTGNCYAKTAFLKEVYRGKKKNKNPLKALILKGI